MTIKSTTSATHFLAQKNVVDYYPSSYFTAFYSAPQGSSLFNGFGTSFRVAETTTLDSCSFHLDKYGTPTGDVYAELYLDGGTYGVSSKPTAPPLATSDVLDISTLTTSYALTDLTFSGANQVTLTAGTNYIIAIRYNGGDANSGLNIGVDATNKFFPGNMSVHTAAGWNVEGFGTDLLFYVFGPAASPVLCDYLNLSNSHVVGTPWSAGTHSVNTVDNSGWDFPTGIVLEVRRDLFDSGIRLF
jgi:hypothetical protein